MDQVGVQQIRSHLTAVLNRVSDGEEIVITKSGRPIARLVPIDVRPKRELGFDAGAVFIAENFDGREARGNPDAEAEFAASIVERSEPVTIQLGTQTTDESSQDGAAVSELEIGPPTHRWDGGRSMP